MDKKNLKNCRKAFEWACFWDVNVIKPGNVSYLSPGHKMTALDFTKSAFAAANHLFDSNLSIGEKVEKSIKASYEKVHCNTNLGIILLCAPIIQTIQENPKIYENFKKSFFCGEFRKLLEGCLKEIDLKDTHAIYRAIEFAKPGGLGKRHEMDVRLKPTKKIIDAMKYASKEDFIAKQYSNNYQDIFFQPVFTFLDENSKFYDKNNLRLIKSQFSDLVQAIFLFWLLSEEDTHIKRKFGQKVACDVKNTAKFFLKDEINFQNDVIKVKNGKILVPDKKMLNELDFLLKKGGFNPGTSADLTVCSIFLIGLQLPEMADVRF